MNMNSEQFLKLLSRKLLNDLSEEDSLKFDVACATNKEYAELAAALLPQSDIGSDDSEIQLAKVWQQIDNISETETDKTVRQLTPTWLKVAAAVLLCFTAGLAAYIFQQKNSATIDKVVTAPDKKFYQTLDDGTVVYLAPHSSIAYNEGFGQNKREIRLKGQAFFDVTKNPKVPLHIQVGQVQITVKGTAFQVNQQANKVTIALIRGLISVHNANQVVELRANQLLIASGKQLQVTALDTPSRNKAVNWQRDSLIFKKETLSDLMILIQHKYRVKIQVKNNKLKLKKFTGVIKTESLPAVLDALKLTYPFSYEIKDSLVIIK